MADDKLPPGVTEDEKLPPGVTMEAIGAHILGTAKRTLPDVSLADRGKATVMPTAGMIGGNILGRRLAGPLGGKVLESIGSGLGTAGNMAAGLQPPSLWDIGQSAAAPMAGRTIGGIARQGMISGAKQLPGYAAAGHEINRTKVAAIPDLIRPGTPSSALYKQLEQMPDVVIDPTNLRTTAAKLLQQEQDVILPGLKDPKRMGMLGKMDAALEAKTKPAPSPVDDLAAGFPDTQIPGGSSVTSLPRQMAFSDYWANVKRIGEKVGGLQRSGGESLGAVKLLYKAAMEDLDKAANHFPLLKSANEAFKKEMAADALHDVITNKVITPTSNGLIQIQPQLLRKWLTNTGNADTVKNISPQELAGIHKILDVAERLPRLPPPQGQQYGSGPKIVTGAMGTLFGGGIGGATGGAMGAATGAAIAGPAFIVAQNLVSKAMQSDIGRKALIKVMDRGPFLDHAAVAALAVAINSGAKAQGSEKVKLGPPDQ